MKPGKLDLPTIWRGCTYPEVIVTWLDNGGNPVDLTGWTPYAKTKQIDLHPVVVNAANGITMISLTKTETENLRLGVENWDWVWQMNGEATPPLLAGKVQIKEPVTADRPAIAPPPVPNPPPAPLALPATAIFYNRFTANWAAAITATGYRLDVATDNAFTHYVQGFQNLTVGTALTKLVTGLEGSTNYYYRVRARNEGGGSPNSNIISVTTQPPPPPVNDNFTNNILITGLTGSKMGTTIGATRQTGEPTGDNSVWYRWRTGETIVAYFSLDTNANRISVYTGSTVSTLTHVADSAGNPPTLSFVPAPGQFYRIRVYKLNHTDDFTLTWTYSI